MNGKMPIALIALFQGFPLATDWPLQGTAFFITRAFGQIHWGGHLKFFYTTKAKQETNTMN